jgi:hypothetical protein
MKFDVMESCKQLPRGIVCNSAGGMTKADMKREEIGGIFKENKN